MLTVNIELGGDHPETPAVRTLSTRAHKTVELTQCSMQGFIVLDWRADMPEAAKQLATWVAEGKIQAKKTVVKGGLQKAEHALADLFKGANTGMVTGPSGDSSEVIFKQADTATGKLVVEVKAVQ